MGLFVGVPIVGVDGERGSWKVLEFVFQIEAWDAGLPPVFLQLTVHCSKGLVFRAGVQARQNHDKKFTAAFIYHILNPI